ncbi:MAG: UDP-3-O-acyl-N-acetylglucosamine deacetylase [Bacteroidales bacterium]|nr:UDP-3-O-acyl-N-acetylglucosamine deacetylase [Bacteroidales bacterium]
MFQRTLRSSCRFEGKGLHTGKFSQISVCPAPPGTGIVFVRTDLGIEVPARSDYVISTRRSTTLGKGCARIGTVEHLLSALTGLGIDNARIELSSKEVPILDGSAAPITAGLQEAGIVEQDEPRRWLEIPRELFVKNGSGSWIRVTPAEEPSLEITVDYGSRVIGVQTVRIDHSVDYASQIAPCRTFCFLHEIWPQLALGLAKGGDVNNAIIAVERPVSQHRLDRLARIFGTPRMSVTPEGYLSNLELRYPDECARHKMLDLIGDLRLCGGFLKARITAFKPGHAINTAAASQIFKSLIDNG